jgi:amidase
LLAGGVVTAANVVAKGRSGGAAFAQNAAEDAPSTGARVYASTRGLVKDLAERRISSVELVEQAIARIEALDGRVNAVVVRDFEGARAGAVAADAALAKGARRPLLGVPMTVKESFNVAGLPTTWGLPMFKGWQPGEDAAAVARLKAAGAVILGKTNLAIGISDWQSYNDVYGTTNNPWDFDRSPGGSSGGSATALACGFVSLELGSDINSSIRAPAHFCGVYGHKPTFGLVPLRGHVPPKSESSGVDVTGGLAVAGPLARSAADLGLVLDVLAGPDEEDAIAYRVALPPLGMKSSVSFVFSSSTRTPCFLHPARCAPPSTSSRITSLKRELRWRMPVHCCRISRKSPVCISSCYFHSLKPVDPRSFIVLLSRGPHHWQSMTRASQHSEFAALF